MIKIIWNERKKQTIFQSFYKQTYGFLQEYSTFMREHKWKEKFLG